MATTALPAGTVTFLYTSMEGSTRLAKAQPAALRGAQARHNALLRHTVTAHGGRIFRPAGDGVCAVFAVAADAVTAAEPLDDRLVQPEHQGRWANMVAGSSQRRRSRLSLTPSRPRGIFSPLSPAPERST